MLPHSSSSEWDIVSDAASDLSDGELVSKPRFSESDVETVAASSSPVRVPRALQHQPPAAATLAAGAEASTAVTVDSIPVVQPGPLVLPSPSEDEQSSFHIPNSLQRTRDEHFVDEPTSELAHASMDAAHVQAELIPTMGSSSESVVWNASADEELPSFPIDPSPPVGPTFAPTVLIDAPPPLERLSIAVASFTAPVPPRPSPPLLAPPPAASGPGAALPRLLEPLVTKPLKHVLRSYKDPSPSSSPASLPFSPESNLPSLGQALLSDGHSDDLNSDIELAIGRKSSSSSGGSNSSSYSTSSTSALVLAAGLQSKSQVDTLLHEPERCFCCRLTWTQRVIGFAATGGIASLLFLLSFFSLGRVLLDTPVAFTCLYVCAHLSFLVASTFLVGPRKSYVSLVHAHRKCLALLYVGLLAVLVYIGLVSRLGWFGLLPVWFVHLAAFSWYCLMYLPLSTAVLARAIALARKANAANQDDTCCSDTIGTSHMAVAIRA